MLFDSLFYPAPDNIWNDDCKIAFNIGNFPIPWYGIFVFIGFVSAIILGVIKLWKWYKIPVDPFYWFCIMGVPTAIFGARIWSCCLGDAHWSEFWNFQGGGLAIEGGVVLTVLLACWWFPFILKRPSYQKRDLSKDNNTPVIRRVSMWNYVDAIVPCILMGQFFGRWGNYFNQELYGPIVNNDVICKFLHDCLPYMYVGPRDGVYHQPLFFYEGMSNLIFFFVLYFGIESIPGRKCGDLGLIYFLWYGVLRIILEPFRDAQYTFTSTYIMTALWIVFAIVMIILNHLVFSKHRDFAVWYWLGVKTKYPLKIRFEEISLNSKRKKFKKVISKLNNLSAQNNRESVETIKSLQEQKESLKTKISYLESKIIKDKQSYDVAMKKTHRDQNQMLYYRSK